ncbi:MAG: hypothetical protein OK452_11020 [Thaumarchaeota archaeon]|nr:hypothetical protein [Nitrososphaerota archaeon]
MPTISAAGQQSVVDINEFFGSTMHYAPSHPIFIKHGTSFILQDKTNDVHTFTLVTVKGLPRTASDVNNCISFAPGICQTAGLAHGAENVPPNTNPNIQGSPPAYTGNCQSFNGLNYVSPGTDSPNVFQCVIGGNGLNVASSSFPSLATAFNCSDQSTCNSNGDSVIIFPGEQIMISISSSVEPGTTLHFMCVFHPWMQGEIIVT